MTFSDWAAYHSRLFALPAGFLPTLTEWCALFSSSQIAPDELGEASKRLALNPPKFPSEHLAGLQTLVREARRESRAAAKPSNGPDGKCDLCSGCGVVAVPGAGVVTAGGNLIPSGYEQTVAVSCSCALGRWMANESKKKLLSIESYAACFPEWRQEMKRLSNLPGQRAQAMEKQLAVEGGTSLTKPVFDSLLDRVLRRHRHVAGLREPGCDEE